MDPPRQHHPPSTPATPAHSFTPLTVPPPHTHTPQVDTEDLVFTLETIVEKFGDEIGPWALELAANLTAAFWKYSGQGEEEDADEFDEENGEGGWGGAPGLVGLCLRLLRP